MREKDLEGQYQDASPPGTDFSSDCSFIFTFTRPVLSDVPFLDLFHLPKKIYMIISGKKNLPISSTQSQISPTQPPRHLCIIFLVTVVPNMSLRYEHTRLLRPLPLISNMIDWGRNKGGREWRKEGGNKGWGGDEETEECGGCGKEMRKREKDREKMVYMYSSS